MHTGTYISPLPADRLADDFPRRLAVLGSTGSIGVNALKVVEAHPTLFTVAALAGARNVGLLAAQAARWRPRWLAVIDVHAAKELASLLPSGYHPEILVGPEGYVTMAGLPEAPYVLSAQVGAAGLPPTVAAARAGKVIALANKESLVLAGPLLRTLCQASGAVILPVDSEHNAIFQCLVGHEAANVTRIILTASGGPFRGKDRAFLEQVTPAAALDHPNWSMGPKISVDSATLMNKGLEFIEATMLYGLGGDRIQVVVHPQSVVHSLVEYHDGTQLAHLGPPDMRIPIAYCLGFPRRLALNVPPLDLILRGSLTFEEPDLSSFPCLKLAMDAIDPRLAGPGHPVILNAANEVAVEHFLAGKIPFLAIPDLVARAMSAIAHAAAPAPAFTALPLEDILALDQRTRTVVAGWIEQDYR